MSKPCTAVPRGPAGRREPGDSADKPAAGATLHAGAARIFHLGGKLLHRRQSRAVVRAR